MYSLSYSDYEGKIEGLMYITVKGMAHLTLGYINENTSRKTKNSVYVSHSLGAWVALITAENVKPRGIVLDCLALSDSIRVKLESHIYTPQKILTYF